jgi:alkanesulfonate monooxygenase SsuD/methylene tetrahydromethanopterin reductase-like flavin-dependent oxidoreductase (luciferase family)
MRIGLALPNQFSTDRSFADEIRDVVADVRLARELGFEAILAGEHRLSVPYAYCSPFPFLGRLAAEAEGMWLVAMNLLPLHNPVDVAEEGATLDAICGGRFILAAALGYREIEFEAFGVPRGTRVARFVESLLLVKKLWCEPEIEHEGTFFKIPRTPVSTRPTAEAGIPIWVAANSEKAVQRIGRLGYSWFLNPHASIKTLKEQRTAYLKARRDAGHLQPADVPIVREVFIDHNPDAAWKVARRFLGGKYDTYVRWGQDKAISSEETFEQPFEDLAADRFIVGTPEQAVQAIRRLKDELGVDWLFFHCHWPGLAHERTRDVIRLLAEAVIPGVR